MEFPFQLIIMLKLREALCIILVISILTVSMPQQIKN